MVFLKGSIPFALFCVPNPLTLKSIKHVSFLILKETHAQLYLALRLSTCTTKFK